MARVAGGENLQHHFCRDLAGAAIERDPSAMVVAMDDVVQSFAMPGTGIPEFASRAKIMAKAGVYDFAIHHDQILVPIVMNRWGLDGLDGLDADAERARDRLVTYIERLGKVARRVESRRGERPVLVTPHQRASLADVLDDLEAPVYVVDPKVMRQTVGFDLHRGSVASADRYRLPSIETVLEGATRIAMLERVNDHENLGSLFRNAAAFGVDAVLLCPQCSDPLYRRSVRVSIGHVLTVPWTRAEPWPDAIARVRELGFTV